MLVAIIKFLKLSCFSRHDEESKKTTHKIRENIVNHIYTVRELYPEYLKILTTNKTKQNLTENE